MRRSAARISVATETWTRRDHINDSDIADFIRHHRVHFEVGPDVVVSDRDRKTVGFQFRLFDVHDQGAAALPGCSKCRELLAGLRSVAAAILPRGERPTIPTIEPFERVLHDSHEVPGADEVALTIRLSHRERYDDPVDACEERCLKEIRQRLKALHVHER